LQNSRKCENRHLEIKRSSDDQSDQDGL
jgi:hypothetical protein